MIEETDIYGSNNDLGFKIPRNEIWSSQSTLLASKPEKAISRSLVFETTKPGSLLLSNEKSKQQYKLTAATSNSKLVAEDCSIEDFSSYDDSDMEKFNDSPLTERAKTALSVKVRKQLESRDRLQKMRTHLGVAPTRFRLGQKPLPAIRTWLSTRSKTNWNIVKEFVSKSREFKSDLRKSYFEEVLNNDYTIALTQGFKPHFTITRPRPIACVFHHLKTPIHLQDGTFGQDGEGITTNREDDNGTKLILSTKNKVYSVILIDANKEMQYWDLEPTNYPQFVKKIKFTFHLAVFLGKYWMYAGLLDQNTIKFFTPKFAITSGFVTSHSVVNLLYHSSRNELIVVGTQEISFYALNASVKNGELTLQPSLTLNLRPTDSKNQWLDSVEIIERQEQLWVAVENKVKVYNLQNGNCIHTIAHYGSRKVTCIKHHQAYQYTLIGSIDGTVINIVFDVVHEFFSHAKAVCGLSVFRTGPMYVSVGKDNTLRLYNLKYFKEIFSVHLKEEPMGIEIINEEFLIVRNRANAVIWATNQLTSNFTTLSSDLSSLTLVNRYHDKPSVVLARTFDGVNRLISPVNALTITTTLPLLETDSVVDIAYIHATNRLFILLATGEIWIFRTDRNPCTIVDIWDFPQIREEKCKFIIQCVGKLDLAELGVTAFALVFGITENGHLLLYGRSGTLIDRYQLCIGSVTDVTYCEYQQCLFSCGTDKTIRIFKIEPLDENMLQLVIEINIDVVPNRLGVLGNIIAFSEQTGKLSMVEYNIKQRDYKLVQTHPKEHDHTGEVNNIISHRKLNIFISTGKDNYVRVWTYSNELLREIQFQEPISTACFANEEGDLLISIGNRIEIVKNSACTIILNRVFPNYANGSLKYTNNGNTKAQEVLLFNDQFLNETRPGFIRNLKKEYVAVDNSDPWAVFEDANMMWYERIKLKSDDGIGPAESRIFYENELVPVAGIDQSKEFVEETIRSILARSKIRRHGILGVQRKTDFAKLESASSLDLKTFPNLDEVQLQIFGNVLELSHVDGDSESETSSTHSILKHFKVKLAVDIALPNSDISKAAYKWLNDQGLLKLVTISKKTPKASSKKKRDRVDKERRSREYREKLKQRTEKILQDEKISQAVETPLNALLELDSEPEDQKEDLRIGNINYLVADSPMSPIERTRIEIELPKSVERLMDYEWFNLDSVFHPYNYEDKTKPFTDIVGINSRGVRTRVPKIEGEPAELYPILAQHFKMVSNEHKKQVIQYLNWLHSEYEPQNTPELNNFIIEQLAAESIIDADDMRCKLTLMDIMLDSNPSDEKFILALIYNSQSSYDVIRFKSIQILNSIGLMCIEEQYMKDEINKCINKAKGDQGPFHEAILSRLDELGRLNLKEYLIETAINVETARLIETRNHYGADEEIPDKLLSKNRPKSTQKPVKIAKVAYASRRKIDGQFTNSEIEELEKPFEVPKRDLDENIPPEIFELNSMKVRNAIIDMRTTNFASTLDRKIYKKLEIQLATSIKEGHTLSDRDPLIMLEIPYAGEYIDAFNYLFYKQQLKTEGDRKRLERLNYLRNQKREQELRLIQEREMQKQLKAQQAAARLRMIEERQRRIELLRLKRSGQSKDENSTKQKGRMKFSEMQTKGVGRTHRSKCKDGCNHDYCGYGFAMHNPADKALGNNSLTVFLRTVNKSMPVNQVAVQPFGDSSSSDPKVASKPKKALPIKTNKSYFLPLMFD